VTQESYTQSNLGLPPWMPFPTRPEEQQYLGEYSLSVSKATTHCTPNAAQRLRRIPDPPYPDKRSKAPVTKVSKKSPSADVPI
jgi:hypothetical protein